jgi:predicted nucleic acid-binding protein
LSLYLDTSVLVSALSVEPDSQRIQSWLGGLDSGDAAISDWVVSEFSSAVAFKLRTGQMTPEDRSTALSAFKQLQRQSLLVLPVERPQFELAAQFADHYALGLRAPDCLHLAVCFMAGRTMCTLDRRVMEAGPVLGVQVLQP